MVGAVAGRRGNVDYMITNEAQERVRGWFTGRVPEEWQHEPVEVTVDREEISVAADPPRRRPA